MIENSVADRCDILEDGEPHGIKLKLPNGEIGCMKCSAKRTITDPKLTNAHIPVPTEEEFNTLLTVRGVLPGGAATGKSISGRPLMGPLSVVTPSTVVPQQAPVKPAGGSLGRAISELKSLPMPATIKEFKALQKVIQTLEKMQAGEFAS